MDQGRLCGLLEFQLVRLGGVETAADSQMKTGLFISVHAVNTQQ